jgi:uncharacterized protein (DUF1778 family)
MGLSGQCPDEIDLSGRCMYTATWEIALMAHAARKENRFDLRATPQQSTVIRRAAATVGRSNTDFILESAMERAVNMLADQRLFLVDDESWTRFQAALDAPAQPVAALVDLLRNSDI